MVAIFGASRSLTRIQKRVLIVCSCATFIPFSCIRGFINLVLEFQFLFDDICVGIVVIIVYMSAMTSFSGCQWTAASVVKPRSRVELHVHMDGAVRLLTIWELSKAKGLPCPGDGSLKALEDAIVCKTPSTLCNFLKGFKWITPIFVDDLATVERVAYELCEDKAKDGVLYFEMRYSPHEMVSGNGLVSPRDVVKSSLVGMRRGQKDFSIKAGIILCCMRNMPEYAHDVLQMCVEFQNDGVVGIDLAGDEAADVDVKTGIEKFHPSFVNAFQDALSLGIHRTAHVGEAGPANGVETAMNILNIQRVGHGYHTLTDEAVYDKAKTAGIHFETCPYSSILTGSVPMDIPEHPIVRFAKDDTSFSISTDDPTITDTLLTDEYRLMCEWGLTEAHLIRANVNAIRAAFLPEDEKTSLMIRLKETLTVYE